MYNCFKNFPVQRCCTVKAESDGYFMVLQHQVQVNSWAGILTALHNKIVIVLYSLCISLKVPGSISQNGNIFIQMNASYPKKSWFQISIELVEPFGCKTRLRILHCLYLTV